jgi:hypothetical protein
MSPFSPWTTLTRLRQGCHLRRLHQELIGLGEQVREAVAQAIGHAVAGIARQSVLSLLAGTQTGLGQSRLPVSPAAHSPSLWQTQDDGRERDGLGWPMEPRDWDSCDEEEEQAFLPPSGRRAEVPPVQTWRPALALALQALALWFWRQLARWPVRAALGFGLACTLALSLNGTVIPNEAGFALTVLTNALAAVATV